MANYYSLADLASPQFSATRGRNYYIPYDRYLEGVAQSLPQIKEAEYQRELLQEQQRMDAEARRQERRDAQTALGLETARVGVQAYPHIKNSGFLANIANRGANVAGEAASYVGPGEAADVGATASGATSAGTGILGGIGVGSLAGRAGGTHMNREIGKLGGLVTGKDAQTFIGGGLKGAAAGALAGSQAGSVVPIVGTGIGAGVGALVGFLSGGLSSLF